VNVPLSDGVITSDDIWAEIGEVIAGVKVGRDGESEITVFDSTGLAIQDIATATIVYNVAKERGLGRSLSMF
jgi:alanine dehydrogenase